MVTTKDRDRFVALVGTIRTISTFQTPKSNSHASSSENSWNDCWYLQISVFDILQKYNRIINVAIIPDFHYISYVSSTHLFAPVRNSACNIKNMCSSLWKWKKNKNKNKQTNAKKNKNKQTQKQTMYDGNESPKFGQGFAKMPIIYIILYMHWFGYQ